MLESLLHPATYKHDREGSRSMRCWRDGQAERMDCQGKVEIQTGDQVDDQSIISFCQA